MAKQTTKNTKTTKSKTTKRNVATKNVKPAKIQDFPQAQQKANSKPVYKNWWFWVIIAVVILGIYGIGMQGKNTATEGDASDSNSTTTTTTSEASNTNSGSSTSSSISEKTEYSVGETAEIRGYAVTVTGVDKNYSTGKTYITPDDGEKFVKVDITIENKSNDKQSFNALDWQIEDSNGSLESYLSGSAMAQADDSLGSGDLVAGGKKSGSIVFEVPAGDNDLKVHFSPSYWSSKEVVIRL